MSAVQTMLKNRNYVRSFPRDILQRLKFGPEAPRYNVTIYPRLSDVRQGDVNAPGFRIRRHHSGKVVDGDWDRAIQVKQLAQTKIESCRMRFFEGAEWDDTPVFIRLKGDLEKGRHPDGLRTIAELVDRYRRLDAIFAETRARGRFLTSEELAQRDGRDSDPILISVGRDGSCLRHGYGAHRFAIATLLDLPEIPAQVGLVHPAAVVNGHYRRLTRSSVR